jgi:hypothetical protein
MTARKNIKYQTTEGDLLPGYRPRILFVCNAKDFDENVAYR